MKINYLKIININKYLKIKELTKNIARLFHVQATSIRKQSEKPVSMERMRWHSPVESTGLGGRHLDLNPISVSDQLCEHGQVT